MEAKLFFKFHYIPVPGTWVHVHGLCNISLAFAKLKLQLIEIKI